MTTEFARRDFLKFSTALAGTAALGSFSCVGIANAAPAEVPTIDKLTIRVLVDQQHDQFLRGSTVNGVVHEGPGPARSADARNVLHNEWGLSLFLEIAAGPRTAKFPARFRLHVPGHHQQYRLAQCRSGQAQCVDRQPWAHRPLWRIDRLHLKNIATRSRLTSSSMPAVKIISATASAALLPGNTARVARLIAAKSLHRKSRPCSVKRQP